MEVIVVSSSFILGLALSLLLAEAALCAICLGLKPHRGSARMVTPERLWNTATQPMPEFAVIRCVVSEPCGRPAKPIAGNSSSSAFVSTGRSAHSSFHEARLIWCSKTKSDGTSIVTCRGNEYDVERAKGGTGLIMTDFAKVP